MSRPDAEQQLLERRARELARRPLERARETDRDVLVFTLARGSYALELHCLRHVFQLRELALLPGAEPPLIGVTPWRGDLIRVLDLMRILDLPEGGPTDRGQVLVLGSRAGTFALLADAIVDVVTLTDSLTAVADSRFVRSVTADAVTLLDGDELIRTFTGEAP